ERLVEIAHAKEQQHARMALFGLLVLLHHGGQVGFGGIVHVGGPAKEPTFYGAGWVGPRLAGSSEFGLCGLFRGCIVPTRMALSSAVGYADIESGWLLAQELLDDHLRRHL